MTRQINLKQKRGGARGAAQQGKHSYQLGSVEGGWTDGGREGIRVMKYSHANTFPVKETPTATAAVSVP